MGPSFCSRVFPYVALGALAVVLGCKATDWVPAPDDGVLRMPSVRETHPRLRFVDGQVSLNDSCMIVTENPLNPSVPPLYVNGQPLGFC